MPAGYGPKVTLMPLLPHTRRYGAKVAQYVTSVHVPTSTLARLSNWLVQAMLQDVEVLCGLQHSWFVSKLKS